MTVIANPLGSPSIQGGITGPQSPVSYGAVSGTFNVEGLDVQSPWTLYDRIRGLLDSKRMRIPLERRFEMRPEHLSLKVYRTADLWWLLLKMNKCLSHSDFRGPSVWIYDPAEIRDLEALARDHPPSPMDVGPLEGLELYPL